MKSRASSASNAFVSVEMTVKGVSWEGHCFAKPTRNNKLCLLPESHFFFSEHSSITILTIDDLRSDRE